MDRTVGRCCVTGAIVSSSSMGQDRVHRPSCSVRSGRSGQTTRTTALSPSCTVPLCTHRRGVRHSTIWCCVCIWSPPACLPLPSLALVLLVPPPAPRFRSVPRVRSPAERPRRHGARPPNHRQRSSDDEAHRHVDTSSSSGGGVRSQEVESRFGPVTAHERNNKRTASLERPQRQQQKRYRR